MAHIRSKILTHWHPPPPPTADHGVHRDSVNDPIADYFITQQPFNMSGESPSESTWKLPDGIEDHLTAGA